VHTIESELEWKACQQKERTKCCSKASGSKRNKTPSHSPVSCTLMDISFTLIICYNAQIQHSLTKIVVFPAASNPTIRILTGSPPPHTLRMIIWLVSIYRIRCFPRVLTYPTVSLSLTPFYISLSELCRGRRYTAYTGIK
jgi:hypothetical protein